MQCRWKRSTSAPVTSMDRHTSTKSWQKVSEARTSRNEPTKERKTKQRFRAVFLDLSEQKFCAENLDLSCAIWMREKYERTCHVYGQTHKCSLSLKISRTRNSFVQCSWTLASKNSVQKIWTLVDPETQDTRVPT